MSQRLFVPACQIGEYDEGDSRSWFAVVERSDNLRHVVSRFREALWTAGTAANCVVGSVDGVVFGYVDSSKFDDEQYDVAKDPDGFSAIDSGVAQIVVTRKAFYFSIVANVGNVVESLETNEISFSDI